MAPVNEKVDRKGRKAANVSSTPASTGEHRGVSYANVATGVASDATTDRIKDDTNAAGNESVMARDIARIYELLQKTSEQQETKLNDIKRATDSMDGKLTELTSRINDIEGRLDFLEDADRALKANPPASMADLDALRQKVDELDNRGRRNNLRIVGFPESCEKGDPLSFLQASLPEILGLEFPRGLELDRAHRSLARPRPDGKPPRHFMVRFLRYQDKERVLRAARERENVTWEGHRIMFFPDYSRIVDEKRRQFNQCKRLLHERHIKFALKFPATLVFKTKDGQKTFDNPKQALSFINAL